MSKPFDIPQQVIYVCAGSKCKKHGGKDVGKLFREQAKSAGLKDSIEIIKTECTDRCKFAPIVSIQPQNVWLHDVMEYQVPQLFRQYLLTSPKTPSHTPTFPVSHPSNAPEGNIEQ
ncbi:(2Fe-2S) ferredoxin domain-containing protein [Adhaeribacter radiodurans]|uniref:(2Fe-2S) ferredoxin domain-containing protein n=1 Tax=Adhaeribacter radiodurans TaxID=2745197 RepID=A0A7L7LEB0_9BACT|nr:(2Fe-2S) ferredoxin domain-containing protein [Adhaeribacter radiodurans]QMU30749.1 (2Fe-2S) ferredoxin domain-containing protein [Adhaeribacter radiodurans]